MSFDQVLVTTRYRLHVYCISLSMVLLIRSVGFVVCQQTLLMKLGTIHFLSQVTLSIIVLLNERYFAQQ